MHQPPIYGMSSNDRLWRQFTGDLIFVLEKLTRRYSASELGYKTPLYSDDGHIPLCYIMEHRSSLAATWEGGCLRASGRITGLCAPAVKRTMTMNPGRNDPCPCRSGQKYKKCCGKDGTANVHNAHPPARAHATRESVDEFLPIEERNRLVTLFQENKYAQLETEARLLTHQYPHIGFVWKVLGVALKSQGKDALLPLKKAAELMPNDVESHCNLALALQDIGQLQAAVACCRRALVLKPDYVQAYNNLSNALRELRQLDAAAESARRAMVFDPSFASAYHGLGIVMRNLGDNSGAAENCHRALQIAPQLTRAITFMAELEADKGDFARAEELLRRAIVIEPDLAEGWAGIAAIRKMTKADSDWLDSALSIVSRALPPRDEARLRFAIGKFYDDVREFDHAFAHYQRANELCKLYGGEYNRPQQTLAVDVIQRIYSRDWLEREQRHGDVSQRPVFIVGMPRTGTSLAEQILASHPSVFGAGELSFWKDAIGQHAPSVLTRKIDQGALPKLARDYLAQLQRFSPQALRVIDKMPGNFLHLGLIHAAFPHARIIHMQRNPIDTCLSIYFQHFNTAHAYANDLEDILHYYGEYSRLMTHWREVLPEGAILHVPYEGLVDDLEGWSRKMLNFIDLPWDARCIDFHQCRRTVTTASNWQVRQKITKNSVQRWRNYEQFIGPLKKLIDATQDCLQVRVRDSERESVEPQHKLAQILRHAEQLLRGDESANDVTLMEKPLLLREVTELALPMR